MMEEPEEEGAAEAWPYEGDLPDEIWLAVFSFLADTDLLGCALVCVRWRLLAQDARCLREGGGKKQIQRPPWLNTQPRINKLF